MTVIVPKLDRRLGQFVLVTQRAQARSAQQKVPPSRRVETEPTSGEHPQEMPARKNQHIAFDCAHSAHNAVGPRADRPGAPPPGAPAEKVSPSGTPHMVHGGAAPLILP